MVFDPACVAHAAGRDDYFRLLVEVDFPGFLRSNRNLQPREADGIDPLLHQRFSFPVKTVPVVLVKNAGGLHRQRTVHVNRKIKGYQPVRLDLTDKVEHFLGAPHGKGGDHQISAPGERSLDDFRQGFYIVRRRLVLPVAVGRLHDHVVRLLHIAGVLDQRLVQVPDVPGKYDFFLRFPFRQPDFNAGGAKQMSHIHKADFDSLLQSNYLIIRAARQMLDQPQGVLHGVGRNVIRLPGPAVFLGAPFRLHHLNVGAVAEHDIAEIRRGLCGVHRSPESVGVKGRQISRVVDVGVGQQHKVQLRRRHRNGFVFVDVGALLHAAVHQKLLSRRLQIIAAAGHLMGGAQKCKLHRLSSSLITIQGPFSKQYMTYKFNVISVFIIRFRVISFILY